MADLKFNCPHCSQTITCDELWAGHELQCPACKGAISVPTAGSEAAPSLVPKPPEAPARLSIGRPQHTPAPAPHAAGGSKFPAGNPMARKPAAPAKKQGNLKKILTYSVALIVCAVGGYFGVTYVMQLQEKANEK